MEPPTNKMWGPIWLLENVQQYPRITIFQGGCDLASLSPERVVPINEIQFQNLNSGHVAIPFFVG